MWIGRMETPVPTYLSSQTSAWYSAPAIALHYPAPRRSSPSIAPGRLYLLLLLLHHHPVSAVVAVVLSGADFVDVFDVTASVIYRTDILGPLSIDLNLFAQELAVSWVFWRE